MTVSESTKNQDLSPDLRKPYVGRTQFTRTWYWKCDRCTRHVIMSGQPHHMVLYDALLHAASLNHYYNRYTTKGAPQ